MELAQFRALLTPEGQRLLADACTCYDASRALQLATRLRRAHPHQPAPVVAAALTQAELRQRAHTKFGADADRMYFTPDGYEQATRAPVADHRAARFARAGIDRVADLGCGIGGDLISLARAGIHVAGVDLDPLRVEVARANVLALGLDGYVHLEVADADEVDLTDYDAAFADPDRRTARGRTFDPGAYRPSWAFVTALLERDACVKVAPGIGHHLLPQQVEAEWVSDGGEVKEAALWSGCLRTPATRRATVLPDAASMCDADDPGSVRTSKPLGYLYEPDGAVIRAALVTAVAARVDGALLDARIAYITTDTLVGTPFAMAYRIRAVLPYDLKALRAALRARDVGTVTIKTRGVDVDPDTLRRRLRVTGPNAATVVLARVDTGALALLVEAVRPDEFPCS